MLITRGAWAPSTCIVFTASESILVIVISCPFTRPPENSSLRQDNVADDEKQDFKDWCIADVGEGLI